MYRSSFTFGNSKLLKLLCFNKKVKKLERCENMRTLSFKSNESLKHRNTQNGSKFTNHKSETMTFFSCGLTKAFDHSTCLRTCPCQETRLITMLETAGNNSSIHSLTISVGIGSLLQDLAGCKQNHFYSLPFGLAEASIY